MEVYNVYKKIRNLIKLDVLIIHGVKHVIIEDEPLVSLSTRGVLVTDKGELKRDDIIEGVLSGGIKFKIKRTLKGVRRLCSKTSLSKIIEFNKMLGKELWKE